jgi:LysM repeat protein
MYRKLTLFFLFLTSLQAFAQPKNCEIEVRDGNSYYVYIVQNGNTLWGIYQLFNVPVEEIILNNPGTEKGIKDGQRLYIPVKDKKEEKKKDKEEVPVQTYIVKEKETLYGISKKFGLKVDDLIQANPGVENGVQVDQEIIIPSGTLLTETIEVPVSDSLPKYEVSFTCSIIEHVVLDHETMYSISKRFMVPVKEIQKLNGLTNNRIKAGDVLKIAVRKENVKEIGVREVEPIVNIRVDSTLLFRKRDVYEVVILLPFLLERKAGYSKVVADLATEFYMGAKLALDSLEKLGLKAHVKVIDSDNDTNHLKKLLKSKDFVNLDMVIGPFHGSSIEIVSKWCKENRVKFVCPVSLEAKLLENNPFVYAVVPSSITLMNSSAKYLLSKEVKQQVILVKPKDEEGIVLYESFRNTYLNAPCKGVRPKLIEATLGDFKSYLKRGGDMVVVIPTSDKSTAISFMNQLSGATLGGSNNITIMATKDWVNFDEILASYKNRYKLQFASPNDLNYAYDDTKAMLRTYRSNYNADMTKMAVQGFDVVLYFGQKFLMNETPKPGLMTHFEMLQKGFGHGFENGNCFIIGHEDFELVKLGEIHE